MISDVGISNYVYYDESERDSQKSLSYSVSSAVSTRAGQSRLQVEQSQYVQLASQLHEQLDPPHLLLFLDINQTVMLKDGIQAKSANDAINDALADIFIYQWDPNLPEMDYKTYIKEHLYANPNKDPAIKKKQKEAFFHFVQFLEENDHPLYPAVKERYDQAKALLEKQDGMIFNSFYKMLEHLDDRSIPYTLIFRTFGGDGPEVVKELNSKLGDDFVVYKEEYAKLGCENPRAFYEYCKNVREIEGRHIVIRDNWYLWDDHNEEAEYGKPFPMDFSDRKYLPLFFDDHAYVIEDNLKKNAISPYDLEKGAPIDPKEAIDRKRLFAVEPLEALEKPDYFATRIDEAISYRRSELIQADDSIRQKG